MSIKPTNPALPHHSYINFAFGDEPLETVYGANVPRLQKLKNQYDPTGRFNQFFPLSKGTSKKLSGGGSA